MTIIILCSILCYVKKIIHTFDTGQDVVGGKRAHFLSVTAGFACV